MGKLVETWFKHTLLVFQCLHLSRTYETHDAFVGVLGMITSAIDVRTQWPEVKLSSDKPSTSKCIAEKSSDLAGEKGLENYGTRHNTVQDAKPTDLVGEKGVVNYSVSMHSTIQAAKQLQPSMGSFHGGTGPYG